MLSEFVVRKKYYLRYSTGLNKWKFIGQIVLLLTTDYKKRHIKVSEKPRCEVWAIRLFQIAKQWSYFHF